MTSTITAPSLALLAQATPIAQGAEAKIYKTYLHASCDPSSNPVPVLLKYRFRKQYRHPSLDTQLTKSRVAGEARALLRCLRAGVHVPGMRMVDAQEGILGLEWIEGKSVRLLLPAVGEEENAEKDEFDFEYDADKSYNSDTDTTGVSLPDSDVDPLEEYGISQDTLTRLIGGEIAKMHKADIIHGDLTTSNMMLRHPLAFKRPKGSGPGPQLATELILIDFGLSYLSSLVEDKAVDLYVLERAFSSTHPDSQQLFASVLAAYRAELGEENWARIGGKLDEVRLRGRKRSMVG